MTPEELAAVRGRLEEFAAEMFAPLARRDQRDKSATYVRGLLLDGRRKSMQPMAERLGVDEQGLQQFITSPPGRWSRCARGWPGARWR
jgi:SRSO17 transposase